MTAASTVIRGLGTNLDGFDPLVAATTLRAFMGHHETVHLQENGRRVARLSAEHSGFSICTDSGKLVCHFWSPDANIVRRVVGVVGDANARRLRLKCVRMGRGQPVRLLLEAGGEGGTEAEVARTEFRQAVIAAVQRDWHGWSHEPSRAAGSALRSGTQRLLFRRGQGLLPCIAVDERESPGAAASALAQALVWAEQVRAQYPAGVIQAVRLILPPGAETLVSHRRRWLKAPPLAPAIECYRLDRAAGQLSPVPLSDCGNFISTLRRATGPAAMLNALEAEAAALLADIRETCPQTTLEVAPDGGHIFRLYGLEIVRQAAGAAALVSNFSFGYGREQSPLLPATRPLFRQFLRELGTQRVPGRDRRDLLYALQPERWMEHLLRSDLNSLDPHVDCRFVYSQVPVCLPGQRDVLDLLAVDRGGRLLVLELKAGEDLGFPLQALDYWLRVRHHQLAGDFERLGYFPGIALSSLPPRLWLVAPALRWHPQTEIVGRWISPEVPWTRIGINEEWRHGIQVVYRKEPRDA